MNQQNPQTGRAGPDASSHRTINIHQLKTVCSSCSLRELCLPMGLSQEEVEYLDQLVYTRKRIKRGENLYRAGDPFGSLYAVRSGFFKSNLILEDGRDQVTGFHMPGEIMGLDGIGTDDHTCNATALEDSEVCVIPFARLEELGHQVRNLQKQFHKVMSREIVRDQGVMMLLGTMRAEERLAAFLLNLSQRFNARGYSHTEFHLRMTREEIGSYLGLKLETVSRIFSKFQEEGLVSVQQKHIRILHTDGLKRMLGQAD
jgi:CRP/FNR family transcriptional regulator